MIEPHGWVKRKSPASYQSTISLPVKGPSHLKRPSHLPEGTRTNHLLSLTFTSAVVLFAFTRTKLNSSVLYSLHCEICSRGSLSSMPVLLPWCSGVAPALSVSKPAPAPSSLSPMSTSASLHMNSRRGRSPPISTPLACLFTTAAVCSRSACSRRTCFCVLLGAHPWPAIPASQTPRPCAIGDSIGVLFTLCIGVPPWPAIPASQTPWPCARGDSVGVLFITALDIGLTSAPGAALTHGAPAVVLTLAAAAALPATPLLHIHASMVGASFGIPSRARTIVDSIAVNGNNSRSSHSH